MRRRVTSLSSQGLLPLIAAIAIGCSTTPQKPRRDAAGGPTPAQSNSANSVSVDRDDLWLKASASSIAALDASQRCQVAYGETIRLDPTSSRPEASRLEQPANVLVRLTASESQRLCPGLLGRVDLFLSAEAMPAEGMPTASMPAENSPTTPSTGTSLPEAAESTSPPVGATQEAFSQGSAFTARGTGYYPADNGLQGGFLDRKGRELRTLQQYLSGEASYVSVAMDASAFPYGTVLHITQLDEKYQAELAQIGRQHIDFCVVDTGGAFRGRGTSRIDICTSSNATVHDATINGDLSLYQVLSVDGSPKSCL